MNRAIWVALVLMVAVGMFGMFATERYIAESAALTLVGLALALRRLTWGS